MSETIKKCLDLAIYRWIVLVRIHLEMGTTVKCRFVTIVQLSVDSVRILNECIVESRFVTNVLLGVDS